MSITKIDIFGGELPSVSPRALPAGAAQLNQNLYAKLQEFRPLNTDLSVATSPSGTQTIYRFARKSDGSFNDNASTGWITSTSKIHYVKGQINDERTERTYLTYEDGSAAPRVIDVTGEDRKLGVPRPLAPEISINQVDEFTAEDADLFLYSEVADAVANAIKQSVYVPAEPAGRFSGTTIFSGSYSNHGLSFPTDPSLPSEIPDNYWQLWATITTTRATTIGLELTNTGAITVGSNVYVPVAALPYTVLLNEGTLQTALSSIVAPTSDAPRVFSDEVINSIRDAINSKIDPQDYVKSQRDELNGLIKEFADLISTGVVSAQPTRPTEPLKPTTAEYLQADDGTTYRDTAWMTYDEDYNDYEVALEEYNQSIATRESESASLNSRLRAIQSRTIVIVQEIEQKIVDAWKSAAEDDTWAKSLIDIHGGRAALLPATTERVVESRFYLVTMVTDWGEESQPSEPTEMIEVDQNDTVNVARPTLTTGETYASRNITKWRLYRTNTGSQLTSFQFVEEFSIATGTYIDEKAAEELGEVIASAAWVEPPYRQDGQSSLWPKPVSGTNPYLRGLIGMPNGIMAGFIDNAVAFCEPYHPYAWPVEYQIVTEYPIVGLGVFGQTLFVGTTANPYFISGADSASMSAIKLDSNQSCVSAQSIASVQGGVLYASPDGLCVADQSGVKLVTAGMFTRDDWQSLNPESMFAIEHENIYYLFYDNGTKGCFSFDLDAQKLGRIDLAADCAFVDRLTDTLYVSNSSSISAVFGGSSMRNGAWKSIKFTLNRQEPFAWLRVLGDQSATYPATVKWYANGILKYTATLTGVDPVRLPAGRFLEHEVELTSQARITQVFLCSNTEELQQA